MDVVQRPLAEGPLAVDLANTQWQDDDGSVVDWLATPEAVEQLLTESGIPGVIHVGAAHQRALRSSR